MFRQTSFVVLFLLAHAAVQAGGDTIALKKNVVYVELLGKGISGSLNYERLCMHKGFWQIRAQLGVGYGGAAFGPYVPIPVSVIGLRRFAATNWYAEASLGAVFLPSYEPTPSSDIDEFKNHPKDYGHAIIYPFDTWYESSLGIRYERNWSFRLTCIPIYARSWYDLHYYYTTWAGMSIGRTF